MLPLCKKSDPEFRTSPFLPPYPSRWPHRTSRLLSTITPPSAGATLLSTDNISIAANATDDDTIVAVEFFANDISIGSDNSAPHTLSTKLAAGTYSLTAKATDNDGASTISSVVSITVAPNQPPTIAISSSQAGATFSPSGSITIDVEAEDDGTIISVELFANDSKLADLDAAPYSFSASLAPGTHQLIARATDGRGLISTSAPVQITIEEPTPPEIVAISFGGDTVTVTPGTSSGVAHVLEASTDFFSWQAVATNTPVSGTVTFSSGHADGEKLLQDCCSTWCEMTNNTALALG